MSSNIKSFSLWIYNLSNARVLLNYIVLCNCIFEHFRKFKDSYILQARLHMVFQYISWPSTKLESLCSSVTLSLSGNALTSEHASY